jgi:hypothetical protein
MRSGCGMRTTAIFVRPETLFTTRGERTFSEYPRLYRAGSLDISLHLSRTSHGNYVLVGLLSSRNADETIDAFEAQEVDLYAAPGPLWLGGDMWIGTPLMRTRIDDLGHLLFRDVPAGEFVMVLYLPTCEVIIEGLTIP